jgi:hypothetical protein
MWALASIVGQAGEQWRGIDVEPIGLERHGVVTDLGVAALDRRFIDRDRGG